MYGFIILTCLIGKANSANILGIFPFTAKSHFTMYEALINELHARGHNLTVLSHFPQKTARPNFTDISLIGTTHSLHGNLSLSDLNEAPFNLKDNLWQIHEDVEIYKSVLKSQKVSNFLKSGTKFDLLIIELFNTDIFLALAHEFGAPYISISPCPLLPWAHARVDNPANPSYVPVFFSHYTADMSVVSRGWNALYFVLSRLYFRYVMNSESERAVREYFPSSPPLASLAEDVSLILVNTHSSLHSPPPASPRVIQVGGMHIKDPQPLQDEALLNLLETAEHGVILFSMGSMFRSESLPQAKKDAFEKALRKVRQKVIWKWESAGCKAVNGNILYMDWVPQREVLSHKNVVLFIYHGGLLGVTEAVHSGVPILGVPMFGDMGVNMAAVVAAGAGLSLQFRDITDELLYNTINHMINDPSFKTNANKLSRKYNDRPIPPLETAVYWTEYVIRNKGAPILKTHSLSWYQLWLLDIVLLAFIAIFTVVLPIVIVIKTLVKHSLWTWLKAKEHIA